MEKNPTKIEEKIITEILKSCLFFIAKHVQQIGKNQWDCYVQKIQVQNMDCYKMHAEEERDPPPPLRSLYFLTQKCNLIQETKVIYLLIL